MSSDGTITVVTPPDYETQASYNLSAVATNSAGSSTPVNVTITVTDSTSEVVPTLATFTAEIAENSASGTTVGTVTITDPGDSAITAITLSGSNASHFSVAVDGTVTVVTPPDYETQASYTLSAVAINAAGASDPVDVTITVNNVADVSPILAPFSTMVSDNTSVGSVVGTIIITDPGDSAITSIALSGSGSEDFSVANDGTITVVTPPDYETQSSYTLSAAATNAAGVSDPVDVTITVTTEGFEVVELNELEADTPRSNDDFGYSVAISGGYAVVGARSLDIGEDSDVGAVYVYKKDSTGHYVRIAELHADDGAERDFFGTSVAIEGDYVVIGAMLEDNNDLNASFDCGTAYVFRKDGADNFTQIAKLAADDGAIDDHFGWVVDISGEYIVVGADNSNPGGMWHAGSAYIFKNDSLDNFTQIQKLTAGDAAVGDYFGYSAAISGEYVAIGAFYEDPMGISGAGSAYIFRKDAGADSYTQIDKLIALDPEESDSFGRSIGIDGDYVTVGAYREDVNGITDGGSAYVFKNDGADNYNQVAKLSAGDAESGDQFAISVAIEGSYVVVGALTEDPDGISNAGSAYLFQNDGTDGYSQAAKLTASDASGGDYFGKSIGISGSDVVVGANSALPTSSPDAGSAYVYQIVP